MLLNASSWLQSLYEDVHHLLRKANDHLYRQAKMLSRQGIDIDRSTLAFWVGYAAAELVPLYEQLKEHLLVSGCDSK
jgi:transposase